MFKGKSNTKLLYLILALILMLSVSVSLNIVFSALNQTTKVSNTISVEAIALDFIDGNGNKVSEIPLPSTISAGESITLPGGNIGIKPQGVPSYVRLKITSLINEEESELIDVALNETLGSPDWVKGSDGYYYFCRDGEYNGILSNSIAIVNDISFSQEINSDLSSSPISIVLRAEAIDCRESNVWQEAWGNNPPDEWFEITGNTRI